MRSKVFLAVLATTAIAGPALAQSMTPLQGAVNSFAEGFAVRVYPSNPYPDRIKVEVHVYDQDFYEIPAEVSPRAFPLAAGASRRVTVVVPFDNATERKVRICTESIPFPSAQTKIRAQICGKFIGRRLTP